MRELVQHLTGLVEEKFWSLVDKSPTGCWSWTPGGQALFVIPNVGTFTAARVAYVLSRASEPPSARPFVRRLRTCSDPSCVRPDHLRSFKHRSPGY